jgi:hypothetical protein
MSTTTRKRKSVKPRKLNPVKGTCRWIGGAPTPGQLDGGDAMLLITVEGKAPQAYHVQRFDGRNFRLTKAGVESGTAYDLERVGDGFRCDCPDATHNEERPGGCKHSKALRAALAACSK